MGSRKTRVAVAGRLALGVYVYRLIRGVCFRQGGAHACPRVSDQLAFAWEVNYDDVTIRRTGKACRPAPANPAGGRGAWSLRRSLKTPRLQSPLRGRKWRGNSVSQDALQSHFKRIRRVRLPKTAKIASLVSTAQTAGRACSGRAGGRGDRSDGRNLTSGLACRQIGVCRVNLTA